MDKYVGEANDDTDKTHSETIIKKKKKKKKPQTGKCFVNKQCFLNDKDLTLRQL